MEKKIKITYVDNGRVKAVVFVIKKKGASPRHPFVKDCVDASSLMGIYAVSSLAGYDYSEAHQ